jgi:hypothetical protein
LPDSPGPNQAQEDGVDQPETLPRDASKSDRLASALAKAIGNNRLGQQTQSFSAGGMAQISVTAMPSEAS